MTYVATKERKAESKVRQSTMRMVYVNRQYRYWRTRIFYSLFLGYAAFYLVRQNLTVAAPEMLKEFGYTKSQIGWVFALFSIIYGVVKFISGAICDRTDARYFMSIGLVGASICTFFAGFSHSVWVFAFLYAFNGVFQAMGWPPVSRLMTHWYSSRELGTRWGIINASHQFGSVAILLGGSWLLASFGWRSVFIVPAVIALLLAGILFERLRDTPESLGLPPVEEKEGFVYNGAHKEEEAVTFREIFMKHILPNKALRYVCMANFFVYIIRMGFFNWAPTFLQEAKGASALGSGVQTSIFELTGVLGGIFAGWASDYIFKGRRSCAGFYFMAVLIVLLFLFWHLPSSSQTLNSVLLILIGFFVYGPQTLLGMSGAELGSKRAAATANGLTGTFGYLGGAVSGIGVGKIADCWGWNAVFLFFGICALIGSLFFILNWRQSARH
ncbi:MAG: MFS transporter [Puniceicoccales bacterium]|jgi:phosphoglycerate transporter family protein|nr:MFS transporter [Puniceicoccales bacterium]